MLENKEFYLSQLADSVHIADPLARSLNVLSVITDAMQTVGIRPVLVGGKAVELYTRGNFMTYDTDIILSGSEDAAGILQDLGFQKRFGERHWYHQELDYAIEIPDSALAGSAEKVNEVMIADRPIYVIGFEDLIADRLLACAYWKSTRDCEQAENLMTVHFSDIDFDYLLERAAKEKFHDICQELMEKAKANRKLLGLSD